ncbi:MAG: carboxylating nicotinate-nucleotide diphosphorylase [Acidimicrobiia bacterium]|nr:carboxylating nicotinate-nucleotide diphosphorylase [Acidimicrobiia bacterium]
MNVLPPPSTEVAALIERAVREDLGRAGDITSNAVISAAVTSRARIVARRAGTIAGLDIAARVFEYVDPNIDVELLVADGSSVNTGTVLAKVHGPTRSMLAAERAALNVLGHLSGVATQVAEVVDAVAGLAVQIADTRKTTPGLRSLEKYAVRCGGGMNHRFGLDDAVMIKDNHIAATGSITAAVTAARQAVGHLVSIEVEVDRLDQLDEAVDAGADVVLLDNMTLDELRSAVDTIGGRCVLEASGGITPETVRAIAETGVDVISMGWLTHSAPNLDVALDIEVGS